MGRVQIRRGGSFGEGLIPRTLRYDVRNGQGGKGRDEGGEYGRKGGIEMSDSIKSVLRLLVLNDVREQFVRGLTE